MLSSYLRIIKRWFPHKSVARCLQKKQFNGKCCHRRSQLLIACLETLNYFAINSNSYISSTQTTAGSDPRRHRKRRSERLGIQVVDCHRARTGSFQGYIRRHSARSRHIAHRMKLIMITPLCELFRCGGEELPRTTSKRQKTRATVSEEIFGFSCRQHWNVRSLRFLDEPNGRILEI